MWKKKKLKIVYIEKFFRVKLIEWILFVRYKKQIFFPEKTVIKRNSIIFSKENFRSSNNIENLKKKVFKKF